MNSDEAHQQQLERRREEEDRERRKKHEKKVRKYFHDLSKMYRNTMRKMT